MWRWKTSRIPIPALLVLVGSAMAATAAGQSTGQGAFRLDLPSDSPVSLVSADWGQSQVASRGAALQVDLRCALLLKNSSPRRIRGVSMLVLAQEIAAGGKASVTVPALDVAPGESFPMRVDVRLMRPSAAGAGALVEVKLDGVLFEDLTFYGPNRLSSRRAMLAWELEARRDRRTLAAALDNGGAEAVRREMTGILDRMAALPRLDIQVARAGRATARQMEPVRFAALAMPGAPVELSGAEILSDGGELRFPRVEIKNKTSRAVQYVDIGWMASDGAGRRFLAGSLPATVRLGSHASASITRDQSLRISGAGGGRMELSELNGFIGLVEFDNGELWVPPRAVATVTGEQQRLAEMYRRKGLDAVVAELRRLR